MTLYSSVAGLMETVYLKQNVVVEPLVNQWYAWPFLIYPPTAAMYVANSHLKIMQSFVNNPRLHMAAVRDPEMAGGPFIYYDASRVDEIKGLINSTIQSQAQLACLAEAIGAMDKLLSDGVCGQSLDPLYQKVPEPLRGYVELVYDLHNRPSVRFIEALIYESPCYDPSLQSVVITLSQSDDRPFALSTPVLKEEWQIQLKVPFASEELDELFKMKSRPQPMSFIEGLFDIECDRERWAALFTRDGAEQPRYFNEGGIRISYYGHACLLIESPRCAIITDPIISHRRDNGIPRLTYEDLPASIDYVLLTHAHQDHCNLETLLQLRHRIKNIIVPRSNGGGVADPSMKLLLRKIGFGNVSEIGELETLEFEDGAITSIPFLGEHGDLNIQSKTAYLIRIKGRYILCAADSNNVEPKLYDHIRGCFGRVDVLFLGMECRGAPLSWVYGPLMTEPLPRKYDLTRRLNGSDHERAMNLITSIGAEQVFIYAMGMEPWLKHITAISYSESSPQIIESNKVIKDCAKLGIAAERLFGMKAIYL
jgi:L-ascorbate metabolism protein UlaG (beta-lactamase superfamily)